MINTDNDSNLLKRHSVLGRLKLVTPSFDINMGILTSTFFINLLGLVFPIAILLIYSRVIRHASYNTLLVLSVGVVVAVTLDVILRMCRNWISSWSDARFEHLASAQAVKHILNAKINDYEQLGPGVYLEYINSIHVLKNFFGGQAVITLIDLPFVFIYLAFILYIAGVLVLIPITMLALFAWGTYLSSQTLSNQLKERHQAEDKRMSYIISVLTGIHTIKSMALETPMLRRYERLQQSSTNANYKLGLTGNIASIISNLARQSTIVLIVGIGALLVISHDLSIGGLAACIILAGRTLQPIARTIDVWTRLQDIKLAEEHLELLSKVPVENDKTLPSFSLIHGKIQLDNLSFGYKDNLLFKNLNLVVNANELIGIQGDNQTGKSTLLWLITSVMRPTSGRILIDNSDISEYAPQSIRKKIAYLPQMGVLFNGTVLENITMYRPALNETAYRISESLGLSTLIKKLPKGFDTLVGKYTVEALTPGVKQVICIARALIEDPKIILFDEANGYMDIDLDEHLKMVLEKYKGEKTIIAVSNRPSLLKLADRVYRLEDKELRNISV
jgi:ATP-binding cassette subfamily C protein LapB